MKPIKTKGTNSIFGGEDYIQLPAEIYIEKIDGIDVECIQTVWELSDTDLEQINKTKRIYISMVGEQPQPIDVDVLPFIGEDQ